MSFKSSGLRSRRDARAKLSRNQVAAKGRLCLVRAAAAGTRMEAEIKQAEEWAKANPSPKLPPPARIRIEIPGLPAKVISVRRWADGKIIAGNRITTPKQLGRKLGLIIDQFLDL